VRRAALICLGLAALAAGVVASTGAGSDSAPSYRIVFDNASGLVVGADFRVGGVTVGRIDDFDVVRKQARAIVDVSVADTSFGGLHDDAHCKIAQQSLIGEYFIECEPGNAGAVLKTGTTIPVEQTESPIAADLVQNVMRRPFRERFSIILTELGAGFAARGDDVNATIRRALPALQETNRVLKILGDNRKVLRRLAADSGVIMSKLGDRRKDVSRFVREAGQTAATTAERRDALAETFRRFPGFLAEFTPAITDLGTAAREQTPALADLSAAAPSVTRLLDTLGPFAKASEPAVTSLADAAKIGRGAVSEAASTVNLLSDLGAKSAEPANNLAIVLSDLDDRGRAVEPDPDAPEGKGYTGLEAILQYPFDQSLAINIFDTRGYTLKLNALINECSDYTDAAKAKADPARTAHCSAALGPSAPGVNQPDPGPVAARSERTAAAKDQADAGSGSGGGGSSEPAATATPIPDRFPGIPDLPQILDKLPDLLDTGKPSKPVEKPPVDLLDFLLGP
jgi:virulence factor Mce-like protein